MRVIWKFPLAITDEQEIDMPDGAIILAVQTQWGGPEQGARAFLWALCTPDAPNRTRKIRIAGTGHPIDEPDLHYINTIQFDGGALVFHVFEVMS